MWPLMPRHGPARLMPKPMTPDISDALVSGDGRITRVLPTMGRALLRRPVALLITGVIAFLPMQLLFLIPAHLRSFLDSYDTGALRPFGSLLPPPMTFIVFILLSFCFAASTGPLCWISYRAIYANKTPVSLLKSARALLPVFLLWLLVFFTILLWVMVIELFDRYVTTGIGYVSYILVGILLAALAALPAYLSLFAPVFTLEAGSWRTNWRRVKTLGAGFRWRSLGYSLSCGLAGTLAAFALSTGLVAILPVSIRFQLDDWIYLASFGMFWMMMCVLATALYARIRLARGELDAEDIATVFE